jgi:D-alanine-D-alanine ligase
MRANDIPVVESILVLRKEIEKNIDQIITRIETEFSYPIFVKPANLGSSVGISKCISRSDLGEGLLEAAKFDRRILIERGVNAREIEISVLGNDEPKASVAGEVLPSRDFYSYESKYIDGSSGLSIPAGIPAALSDQIRAMAIKAFKAIDCSGMARVDFFLDKDNGNFYLNELNSLPGFTSISMYPKLWQASDLPYNALVDTLIELALERKIERDRTERSFRSIS